MAPSEPEQTCVNPAILWASPETETHEDGNVIMPGVRERIVRLARIRVGYQDLGGTNRESEVAGFEAAVIQHEIDQLAACSGSISCRG